MTPAAEPALDPPAGPALRRVLMRRLIAPLIGLLLFSVAVSLWLAARYVNAVYDRELYDDAASVASVMAGAQEQDLGTQVERFAEVTYDEVDSIVYSVRIGSVDYGPDTIAPAPANAAHFRRGLIYDLDTPDGRMRAVEIGVPRMRDGGLVTVRIARTTRRRLSTLEELAAVFVVPQLALLAIAVAVVTGGLAHVVRPLALVEAQLQTQALAPVRLPREPMPREVAALVGAVNGLVSRLDEVLRRQRKFTADAAHQLRTPMTALRLQIEDARQEFPDAAAQAVFARLAATVERTIRVAEQLLALARAEQAHDPMPRERIDLVALAREIGAEWVPAAMRARLDLEFEADLEVLSVDADRHLLSEALSNLIDNAIKYCGQGRGRRVLVRVGRDADGAVVAVEDDGPGVPDSELGRLAERFYRGDRKDTPGTGLGLALVSEVMQTHGGRLALEHAGGRRGLRASLHLPVPAQPA
ncbi:sensor histidine kinase [Derxia lacustris]|uniref:sensor histidine kinase n=1 Tax=Derxia lacustris TaxID=764842 RepID=UPI000A16D2EC|nr:HAMP domain-containing sensor histidine kinase [Derxia lacustris]